MDKEEVELKKKLIEKRKAVKQKLKELKEGEIDQEHSFSPITKRLETIAEKINNGANIKNEPADEDVKIDFSYSSPKKYKREHKPRKTPKGPSFIETPVIAESVSSGNNEHDNNEDLDQSVQEAKEYIRTFADSPAIMDYLEDFDPLPREYIHKMISDVQNQFDFRYGVRYDPDSNELKIGNAPIKLDGKDLIINGLTYHGTPGLYELLFKKHPIGFKESDRNTYLNIVKRTNAHRRDYSEDGQIQGNASFKYKTIISALNIHPLTPRKPRSVASLAKKRLGYGMLMESSNNPVEYVHWDDPNELVDRLRLLVASQAAGHTGHTNEIVSIIEELRESRIIA